MTEDAPDQELTDTPDDVGIVLLKDFSLAAFRLSTGDQVWQRDPEAPCRHLVLAASKAFAGCGNKLLSFSVSTGEEKVVDSGPHNLDPIVAGTLVASPQDAGRITLYDAKTGGRRASKIVPELARAFHQDVLAGPDDDGVCVLGLLAGPGSRFTYRAGCYDANLTRRWTKSLAMVRSRDAVYDVRQLGPRFLVLDDQESIVDPSWPHGRGQGYVLSWRDGATVPFNDKTFAILEDRRGQRLSPDVDIFGRTRALEEEHAGGPLSEAYIAADDRRVFALIVNGGTALAGVDRATGHQLFLVPVPLGELRELDIVEGMPIVRTMGNVWVVTIHNPATGAVVYRDTRPLAR